ncbi:MAG: tetratricopeptide repeat protein [Candidatus Scalindua rubra]|nr:tetratricopeptide repeat protein [Candidatus Scalindua rubra]
MALVTAVVGFLLFVSDGRALNADSDPFNNAVRIVKVKAVADEEFRKSPNWVEEIEESFKRSSAFYEEQFGIKFELKQIGEWISDNNTKNIQKLLRQLKDQVGKEGGDLVVGFTRQSTNMAECVFNRAALGVALPFNDYVLVRVNKNADFNYHVMALVLTHELGHVFGALHVDDSSSIMNPSLNDSSIFRFDDNNRELIKLTRFVDLDKGVMSINKEYLDRIVTIYKDSLKYDFENASRHLLIGSIYNDLGFIDEAISAYKEALKLDRKDPESLTRLGMAYAEKGLLDEAIAELSKAVRFDSIDGVAHVNLSTVLVRKNMLNEAVDQLKKAIEINNDNPDAHCMLSGIYIREGLFDEAVYECKLALKIRPAYANAHYNMGIAYHGKLMYDNAVSAYKEAINIENNNLMARNNLGIAYYEQGLLNEAESEYLKLLQIDPVNEMAINNLEAVLLAKREALRCETVRKD